MELSTLLLDDLTDPTLSALDVASRIHDLAKYLVDSEGCYLEFAASITGRTSYPYLNPSYPQKVGDCKNTLESCSRWKKICSIAPFVAFIIRPRRSCTTMGSISVIGAIIGCIAASGEQSAVAFP